MIYENFYENSQNETAIFSKLENCILRVNLWNIREFTLGMIFMIFSKIENFGFMMEILKFLGIEPILISFTGIWCHVIS